MSGVRFRWPGARAFSLSIDDFALPARERVLLVGPSGSGQVDVPQPALRDRRAVRPGGSRCSAPISTQLSNAARDRFRAEHFGIIFQMFNLLPYGSILDNVLLPLELRAGSPRARRRATARPRTRRAGCCRASASTRPSSTGSRRRT